MDPQDHPTDVTNASTNKSEFEFVGEISSAAIEALVALLIYLDESTDEN